MKRFIRRMTDREFSCFLSGVVYGGLFVTIVFVVDLLVLR
jgi:hypothetical protein